MTTAHRQLDFGTLSDTTSCLSVGNLISPISARDSISACDARRSRAGTNRSAKRFRGSAAPRRGEWMAIAAVLAMFVVATPSTATAAPSREARVAHIAAALDQLKANDPVALDREVYEAIRVKCKPAPGSAPAVACMIAAAREVCAKRGCGAAADVLVTNQHAERDLLDDLTRMRLVRTSSDYHAAVIAELRAKYALLAAELVLAKPEGSPAATIDRMCRERDQVARRCAPDEAACLGTIAYQRCVGALVWFTSTQPPKPEGQQPEGQPEGEQP